MIQVSPASFVLVYFPNLSITPLSIGLTVLKPENNITPTPTIAKIIPSQLSPIINKTIETIIGSIPRINIFPSCYIIV